MVKRTLNKYVTDDLKLLESVHAEFDEKVFEKHELSRILEIPLPFISRTGVCCIPDTFAYLTFLRNHSNKNNLSISCKWFNQRDVLSQLLRKRIIAWLKTHEDYMLPNNTPITALKNTV
jgi:hypothetical protein